MKTILVPAGGSDSDRTVFATALLAARPSGAHLEFVHLRLAPGVAAENMPHMEFASGAALRESLAWLRRNAATRSEAASRHVHHFCREHEIPLRRGPGGAGVSASWHEHAAETPEILTRRARYNDAVVLARASRVNGMPGDLLETVLLGSGRPVLIAPKTPPEHLTRTVLLCWRESAEAARALAAALPLLRKAKRVVVVAVEDRDNPADAPEAVAQYLAWHGVEAEARWLAADGRKVPAVLEDCADAWGADLLVMGGYGRSRLRQAVFGGCTQHFLDAADRAVLLLH